MSSSPMKKPPSTRLADEALGIATGIINYFTKPEQKQSSINANNLIINE